MAGFLLYAAVALFAVVYYFISVMNKRFNYFKDKGVAQLKTEFFYGNGREIIQKQKAQGAMYKEFYFKFKKMGVKHGGVYIVTKNSWVPVDPQLIKTIIVKDFQYFSAHNPKFPGLFFHNLFHMDGEEWRDMRRKLTPTFTSGKMKMMYDIVWDKTNGLVDLVDELCKTGESAEIKELLARFTTDVIGNCGFGIECNSMKDINSEFFQEGQSIFRDANNTKSTPLLKSIMLYLGFARPGLPNFRGVEKFFRRVVQETLKYREDNRVVRKDFLHLMIQLKNKGAVTELTNDNEDVFEKTTKKEVMTVEDIAGECILFFTAGFETSSTTMSYVLLELTQNPEVQVKMRKEVREVLKKYDGKLTYDALQELTYCENVIYETLRKYPPVAVLPRLCTKNYTVPGTDIVIEKGTSVNIPVWGLHMDPDYFPEPEKFIPERFNAQNKSKIVDFTYLPFGEGPRMCLGLRFGVMQSKAGIAALINKFNFTLNEKTKYPPEFHKSAFIISVEGGVWINATKVE